MKTSVPHYRPTNRFAFRQSEQFTDYYPYGQPHPDCVNPQLNNRLFSGKELTTALGINEYDFHARTLTLFGAFTAPDPLAMNYPWLSPYAYCASDPINFTDPSGLGWVYGETENGMCWTWNADINSRQEAIAAGYSDYRNPGDRLYGTIKGSGQSGLVELEADGYAHYVDINPSSSASSESANTENDSESQKNTTPNDSDSSSDKNDIDSILDSAHKTVTATDFGGSLLKELAEGEAASTGSRTAKNLAKGLNVLTNVTPLADIALTLYEAGSYYNKGGRNNWVFIKYGVDVALSGLPFFMPGLGFVYVGANVFYYYLDHCTDGFYIDYSTPN